MEAKDLKDILGTKIPNALNVFHDLEKSITPHLVKLNAGRKDIDPELMKHFDNAMSDIKEAKSKLKELKNANNGSR